MTLSSLPWVDLLRDGKGIYGIGVKFDTGKHIGELDLQRRLSSGPRDLFAVTVCGRTRLTCRTPPCR
jgi:hypothetical protein